jgi:hypothetical protein
MIILLWYSPVCKTGRMDTINGSIYGIGDWLDQHFWTFFFSQPTPQWWIYFRRLLRFIVHYKHNWTHRFLKIQTSFIPCAHKFVETSLKFVRTVKMTGTYLTCAVRVFEVLTAVTVRSTSVICYGFRRIILPPSSGSKIKVSNQLWYILEDYGRIVEGRFAHPDEPESYAAGSVRFW